MGKRVLPTVPTLSEAAKRGGDRAKRPLETRTPGPKDMIREEGGRRGRSSQRVRVQLTESAGVVDVDDEFSWC